MTTDGLCGKYIGNVMRMPAVCVCENVVTETIMILEFAAIEVTKLF